VPYSAKDVRARERILNALLLGPPKSGKTVCTVLTLPSPVFVLNTDGPGALDYVASECADDDERFAAEDVSSTAGYERGMAYLRANKAKFKSVVVDNVTFLVESLFKEVRAEVGRDDPRAIYPEITRKLLGMVRELRDLKKHFVCISQSDPGDTNIAGSFGHLVAVSGKAKILLPAMFQDLLWLETTVNDAGIAKREFLLAPAGNWTKGARSVQGLPRMEADFTEFLRLANEGALPKPKKKVATVPAAKPAPTPTRPAAAATSNGTAKPNWKPNANVAAQARPRQ